MLYYFIFGIIISLIYGNVNNISHDNYRIGTIVGTILGQTLVICIWPIIVILLLIKNYKK